MRELSPRADALDRYWWHVGFGFELLIVLPFLVVAGVLTSPFFVFGWLRRRLSE
jgi:hypothetical protein